MASDYIPQSFKEMRALTLILKKWWIIKCSAESTKHQDQLRVQTSLRGDMREDILFQCFMCLGGLPACACMNTAHVCSNS